ncbi:hypothetical protein [Mesorhizobium sp. A623]
MHLVQQWANVIGLCAGFWGVLLLTKEWPFIFGRGLRRFVGRIGTRNVNVAKIIQTKYQHTYAERATQKHRWYLWLYDLTIYFLKLRSRNEARQLKKNAAKFKAPDINLLDQNGILDPDSVERFSASLHNYVDDLVENGEAKDLSIKGLTWVLVGLGFQIFGNLPLPW